MKLRLIIPFLAFILLAPLAANAGRCCYKAGDPYGGPASANDSCEIKTAACQSGWSEVDCASQTFCKVLMPVCCVYKPSDPTKKGHCFESADRSYDCNKTLLNNETIAERADSACTDLPEDACPAKLTDAPTPPAASAPPPAEYPIIKPKIPLNIPTVNLQEFLNIRQEDGFLHIPFISVFLVGAYKLGVGIAAILAVIMIMIGGFVWIAAAGDSGKIGKAKTMISSAVVGLLLTFGSYILLQTINPDLVNFTALKIPVVGMQLVEIADDYNPEIDAGDAGAGGGAPSQYDGIFAKYAPCAGVTPEVLKAIATAESGLNASKVNKSGYIGLFQTKPANCPSRVAGYCADLKDPDNNTAVGAAMIKKTVDWIAGRCPKASAHDQMVMIYVSHNMGYGMLQAVTQSGCDVKTMRQAAISAYETRWPGTAASYSQKYQKGCLDGGKSAATCTGGPKFDYAVKIADRFGGNQVLAPNSGKCPY